MNITEVDYSKTILQGEVNNAFVDCMFHDDEIIDGKPPEDAVIVQGITSRYGLHRGRLESKREQVKSWLRLLPVQFRANQGGGWSFLNACNLEDGTQWTGFQRSMEGLFVLGIGLGIANWLMPRDMWFVFPGGMPYVAVHVEDTP